MEFEKLVKEILTYCVDDYMGLWAIIHSIYGDGYGFNDKLPTWVRQQTMAFVSDLLDSELVITGRWTENGFLPYTVSNECILSEIEKEWDALGRAPNIGDTFLFVASEKGKELAKELGFYP